MALTFVEADGKVSWEVLLRKCTLGSEGKEGWSLSPSVVMAGRCRGVGRGGL